MTTIALDYIHAARHALDEGAIQTARCLLDSAEKQLTQPLCIASATAPKPKQISKLESATIQTSLLTQAKSVDEWLPIVRKWIERLPEGRSFTCHQVCKWIEHESGIILSDQDQRFDPGEHTPIWRRRVSRALGKLKVEGTLNKKSGSGDAIRSCTYLVADR